MPDIDELSTRKLSQVLRDNLSDSIQQWQWDNRNSALQGAFSADKQPLIQTQLEGYFTQTWTHKSIRTAPLAFKQQAGIYADLSQSQLLFSHADTPDLFAAWWPWGHGATISVRLFQAYSTVWQKKPSLLSQITQFFNKN